jgi:hypothetical protein
LGAILSAKETTVPDNDDLQALADGAYAEHMHDLDRAEIDELKAALRECLAMLESGPQPSGETYDRLAKLCDYKSEMTERRAGAAAERIRRLAVMLQAAKPT